MGFCEAFTTLDEASSNYPKKGVCDTCKNQSMEDGMLTCTILTSTIMNSNKDNSEKGDAQ